MSQFQPPQSDTGPMPPMRPQSYYPPPSQPLPPYVQPQQYQQPSVMPPQKPQRKRLILLVVALAVFGVIVVGIGIRGVLEGSSGPGSSVAVPTPNLTNTAGAQEAATAAVILTQDAMTPVLTTPPDTPTPVPTQPPNPHGDVGVTQHSGYWTVTVNSIKKSQGDLVAPKAGDTYVFINVTATNTDTSTHLISVIDFSLRGPDGTTYPYGATDAQEPSGNVLSGQPIRGDVVFEVPVSVHDFTMQFDGDFNPDDTVQWSLSV